jgi:hypothetical protein
MELVSFGKKPVAARLDVGKSSVMRAAKRLEERRRRKIEEMAGLREERRSGAAKAVAPGPGARGSAWNDVFFWVGMIIGIGMLVAALLIALW